MQHDVAIPQTEKNEAPECLDSQSALPPISLHHAEAAEIARAAVLVGAHSFLAIALAISLGPVTVHAAAKQTAMGLLLACTGLALALIQARAGARFINDMEHKMNSSAAAPGMTSNFVICRSLPRLLIAFWVAASVWVCWPG